MEGGVSQACALFAPRLPSPCLVCLVTVGVCGECIVCVCAQRARRACTKEEKKESERGVKAERTLLLSFSPFSAALSLPARLCRRRWAGRSRRAWRGRRHATAPYFPRAQAPTVQPGEGRRDLCALSSSRPPFFSSPPSLPLTAPSSELKVSRAKPQGAAEAASGECVLESRGRSRQRKRKVASEGRSCLTLSTA